MPKIRELTEVERGQIVLLRSQSKTLAAIARIMKCSRCAVRTTLKRYEGSGTLTNRPKSGRKRLTTAREDRHIERIAIRERTKSSRDLSSELLERHGVCISARTVRRRLVESGLHGRIARRKPRLTAEHKKKRLQWAQKYKNWTVEDWGNVLWSDESNIEVRNNSHFKY